MRPTRDRVVLYEDAEVRHGLGLLLGQDVEGGPQQPSLVTPVTLALQLLVTVSEYNITVDNLLSE